MDKSLLISEPYDRPSKLIIGEIRAAEMVKAVEFAALLFALSS